MNYINVGMPLNCYFLANNYSTASSGFELVSLNDQVKHKEKDSFLGSNVKNSSMASLHFRKYLFIKQTASKRSAA